MNKNCECCNNRGWLKTVVIGSSSIADETSVIERCDECMVFKNDKAAAKSAFITHKIFSFSLLNGFQILITFSEN